MAKKNNRGLGKGLDALLGNMESQDFQQRKPEVEKKVSSPTAKSIGKIPIAKIEVNPFQPRSEFKAEALRELSESIKIHGLIQPITVREMGDGNFQLISGERRLRASKLAALTEIPAYIRSASDQEMLEMALLENIQREDLNAIEVAISYRRLMDECALTHEELSERLSKNRSTVTNYVRLLKLPPEMQLALKEKSLSMGHARALLSLEEDLTNQLSVYRQVVDQQLSVRQTELLIKKIKQPFSQKTNSVSSGLSSDVQQVQNNLSERFETKVKIKFNEDNGKGEISIPFFSVEDFNNLLDKLNS